MKKRSLAFILVAFMCAIVHTGGSDPESVYNAAHKLMVNGNYVASAEALESIGSNEDATSLQELYSEAELLMVQGDYAGAASKFEAMSAYSDASQMAMYCKAISAAETLGMYEIAIDAFVELGDFKDSKQMANYYQGRLCESKGNSVNLDADSDKQLKNAVSECEKAIAVYSELILFKDSMTRIAECQSQIAVIEDELIARETERNEDTYQNGLSLMNLGKYDEAISEFKTIKSYKDSTAKIKECEEAIAQLLANQEAEREAQEAERIENNYQNALALMSAEKYEEAITVFKTMGTYKDSATQITICEEAIKSKAYEAAMHLKEVGEYSQACKVFYELGDYKDSASHAHYCGLEATAEKLSNATVGSHVLLGSYEQDGYAENGAEEIEWMVLAKKDNKLLLISRYALHCRNWHRQPKRIAWEDSSLYSWLNNDFFSTAFNSAEQEWNPTVTLLSISEVEEYFDSEEARMCMPTVYAEEYGADTIKSGECAWWLRSPAKYEEQSSYDISASYVSNLGGHISSQFVTSDDIAVRPAVWIKIEQYPLLQKGSKGEDVVLLQQKLIECGFLAGSADGAYGNMTVNAVIEMQKQFSMEPTGIADNAFQRRLFSDN